MTVIRHQVKDPLGVHARPAVLLAREIGRYSCQIAINKVGGTADAKVVPQVLRLQLRCGDSLTITCDGEQEQQAAAVIRAFLHKNF